MLFSRWMCSVRSVTNFFLRKAPATTGVHSTGTSCNEPNVPVFAMSKSDDGYLIQCDPGTLAWTRQHG